MGLFRTSPTPSEFGLLVHSEPCLSFPPHRRLVHHSVPRKCRQVERGQGDVAIGHGSHDETVIPGLHIPRLPLPRPREHGAHTKDSGAGVSVTYSECPVVVGASDQYPDLVSTQLQMSREGGQLRPLYFNNQLRKLHVT